MTKWPAQEISDLYKRRIGFQPVRAIFQALRGQAGSLSYVSGLRGQAGSLSYGSRLCGQAGSLSYGSRLRGQAGSLSYVGLRHSREGITLVELLVVIAIGSILVGLLLPAVQAAREAARRIHCQNNMRQMGYALHQFHDVFHAFPASGWTKSGPGNPQGRFVGWQVMILPMLEQQSVMAQYDRNSDWWSTGNLAQGAVALPVYRCPSSSINPHISFAQPKAPRPALTLDPPLAPSDYAALMGVRAIINPVLYSNTEATRAVMYRNSTVRVADIYDGTSNSISVIECSARPEVFRQRSRRPELVNDQGYGWIDSESGFSLDGASADGSLQGLGPMLTPVAINATNENEPYSFHSGGCYALFADTHVSFITATTDLAIVAAMATRAGSEVP